MDKKIVELTTQIRRDVVRMVYNIQSGHIGGALGCVELFVALYNEILDYKLPFDKKNNNEDVFLLSNGHISAGWYSTLARFNFFDIKELDTFRKLNTRLQGHPTTAEHLEGIRIASGSLGQGLSVGCGIALSKLKSNNDKKVFVLMGDGEIQEGQIWEAAMFASHNKLKNLIGIIDCNGKQIDGNTDDIISLGNIKNKWSSFGWNVLEVDGNNYYELLNTLKEAKQNGTDSPILILMKTVMGKGVSFMENNHKWHGSPPSKEQFEMAMDELKCDNLNDY